MAQATELKPRAAVVAIPGIALVMAIALATALAAAIVLTLAGTFSTQSRVEPRSEAVLQSGRDWQERYEQMSGLESRRDAYRQAAIDSGRDWEQRYKEMFGQ